MGESGEICPDCQPLFTKMSDELAGLRFTCLSQAKKIGQLQREDPDKKLREHAEWDRAHGLFKTWKRLTGHTRSPWTTKRFKQIQPFLSRSDELIIRAITGIAFDPMVTRQKNGLEERHDGWDTLFKSDDRFERYVNRAPLEWKATLEEHAAEVEARR